jgi:hypothetical protein
MLFAQMGASVQFSRTVRWGKEIELLKDHADVAPHVVDPREVVRQLDAVHDDSTALVVSSRLMQRMSVDLPEPDGPQMTMRSRRSTRA